MVLKKWIFYFVVPLANDYLLISTLKSPIHKTCFSKHFLLDIIGGAELKFGHLANSKFGLKCFEKFQIFKCFGQLEKFKVCEALNNAF